ncbi:cytochrome c oxidase subunit II [Methylocystis sp. IM3]|uniref:cytochrome c oxidase subunit II n=1 Tax=unclassified Methylocystis TaxID=2625913 RepID=UPI0030FCC905
MNFTLPQATVDAREVDALILALTLASLAVLALVFGLMARYMVKYRAGSPIDRGKPPQKTWRLEISWTVATLAAFFGLFIWGADLYVRLFQPPANALQIYVVGKQWMWKVEHPGGQREINTLHIPIRQPVQLVMTSEDVIHDFSVPAFRIKHDVLPGRYETLWFTVEMAGVYHLFCTQLCGEGHASMIGQVVAMEPEEYERWLGGGAKGETFVEAGADVFRRHGCAGCHGDQGAGGIGPALAGLYGAQVKLTDGIVKADEAYLRDCIMTPQKRRVAGYPEIMPSFAGQIDEEHLLKLIAYIKSLK